MTFLEKMKIKLNNFSKSRQLLLLDVLDFLVDKGNMNIWTCISSKKFFQSLLDLLKTKDVPEVQMKLLGLIQKWGLNFEDKRNILPNFYNVYNKLRSNNVQFPSDFESNYQIYISENDNLNYNNNNNNDYEEKERDNSDKEENDDDNEETFYYMDSLKDVLKVPNFEHKYRRLVNFLVKMHDNIEKANLLIDSREHAGLRDIINTLREGNNTLIDTISGGRLKDEKLMEITLGTTEDINQTLGRDEDIKNGYKPNKFKSYFVLNNVIYIKNKNYNQNRRNRAKSTRQKKSIQRNSEKYKNYDMDMNNSNYDKNKYKEKMGKPKDANDIFDLFSASNPNNEPQYYTQNNNQNNNFNNNNNNNNINNFFASQTYVKNNNNNNNNQGYPQLRNNPMANNMFNNNGNNNNNSMNFNQGNNMNNMNNNNNNNYFQNNQRGQFNQNNNQQRPMMTNFDILEQKLNNLNLEQNQNNYNYNNNNQNMRFNQGFNNNSNNNNNNFNNGNNNNNLMRMLDF